MRIVAISSSKVQMSHCLLFLIVHAIAQYIIDDISQMKEFYNKDHTTTNILCHIFLNFEQVCPTFLPTNFVVFLSLVAL